MKSIASSTAMPLRKMPTSEQMDDKLKGVAKMYEKQFLRQMVKAMRQTVDRSGFVKRNMAEKIFQEKLDHQHVDKWGDLGGIGLSKVIYDQLIEKYGAAMGIRSRGLRPQGPVPLNGSKAGQGPFQLQKGLPNSPGVQGAGAESFRIEKAAPEQGQPTQGNLGAVDVSAPWSGQVVSAYQSEGYGVIEMQHEGERGEESSFRSTLVFPGKVPGNIKNQAVKAGQKMALWQSQQGGMNWTITGLGTSRGSEPRTV